MKKQIGISQRIQQATTIAEVAKLNRELQSYNYASLRTKAHGARRAHARGVFLESQKPAKKAA